MSADQPSSATKPDTPATVQAKDVTPTTDQAGAASSANGRHDATARQPATTVTRQDHATAVLAGTPGRPREAPGGSDAPSRPDGRQAGQNQDHPARANGAVPTVAAGIDGIFVRDGQNGQSPYSAAADTELDGAGGQRGLDERRVAVGERATGPPEEPGGQGTAPGQETPDSRQGTDSGRAAGPSDAAGPAEVPDPSAPRESVGETDVTEALKARVAELEAANAELETKSVAKDAVIAEQHEAIEAKDAAITERDAALADKDAVIASQWRAISELDYRVDDLAAENAGLKKEKNALETGKADPTTQDTGATPGNAGSTAEKGGLPAGPDAGKAAPDADQKQQDASLPGEADQHLATDRAGASEEEQASQAGIDSRTGAPAAQEQEQPTARRDWRRLVPSNELAGFVGGGGLGLAVTIANVTHQMTDGWSAIAVAATAFAVSGIALVNKIRKKGSDGSRSQG